jgi:hypothetical protein
MVRREALTGATETAHSNFAAKSIYLRLVQLIWICAYWNGKTDEGNAHGPGMRNTRGSEILASVFRADALPESESGWQLGLLACVRIEWVVEPLIAFGEFDR